MSENDFLYALKEDIPADFADDLLAQLHAQEKIQPMPKQYSWWTVAVAMTITAILSGFLIVVSLPSAENVAAPFNPYTPSIRDREVITAETLDLVMPLATLGKGVYSEMALSPDGQWLAIGTTLGVYIHDARDLSAEARFIPEPIPSQLIYAPDGTLYNIILGDGGLGVRSLAPDAIAFEERFTLRYQTMQVMSISPDSRYMLVGACMGTPYFSYDTTVECQGGTSVAYVINLSNGAMSDVIPLYGENVVLSITPDWSRMVYLAEDRAYHVRDMRTLGQSGDQVLFYPPSDILDFKSIFISPDGNTLIETYHPTWQFTTWDIDTVLAMDEAPRYTADEVNQSLVTIGNYRAIWMAETFPIYALIERSGSRMRVYNWETGANIAEFDTGIAVLAQSIASPDGSLLYLVGNDGMVRVWDIQNEVLIATLTDYVGFNQQDYVFTSAESFIGTTNYVPTISLSEWVLSDQSTETFFVDADNNPISSSAPTVSPDGRYLAYLQFATRDDSSLWIHDRVADSHRLLLATANPVTMGFLADGSFAVWRENDIVHFSPELVAGDAGEPVIHMVDDLNFGNLSPNGGFDPVAWSPRGDVVALYLCYADFVGYPEQTQCDNRIVQIRDASTGELLATLNNGDDPFYRGIGLAFSQDGEILSFGYCRTHVVGMNFDCGDPTVRLWQVPVDGVQSQLLDIHIEGAIVSHVSLHHDATQGSILLSASIWEEVRTNVWQDATYLYALTPNEQPDFRRIERGAMHFSPDGRTLLTNVDGQTEVWGVMPAQ